MLRVSSLVGIGLVVISALLPIGNAQAASVATLYARASDTRVSAEGRVSITVRVDPHGNTLDTVNAVVSYPPKTLRFIDVAKTNSDFSAFVPATPKANNGQIAFAAATLAPKIITTDTAIATLTFAKIGKANTAAITFKGSQTARAGTLIPSTINPLAVDLTKVTSQTASDDITAIQITERTKSGATLRWRTRVAASSTVSFGSTQSYSFTASDDTVSTEHSLKLEGGFAPRTTVLYTISGKTVDGRTLTFKQRGFATMGYSVQFKILQAGNPAAASTVRIDDGKPMTTNDKGLLKLSDIAPGNHRVQIGSSEPQSIVVQATGDNTTPQTFTLTAAPARPLYLYGLIIIALGLMGVGVFEIIHRKRLTKVSP